MCLCTQFCKINHIPAKGRLPPSENSFRQPAGHYLSSEGFSLLSMKFGIMFYCHRHAIDSCAGLAKGSTHMYTIPKGLTVSSSQSCTCSVKERNQIRGALIMAPIRQYSISCSSRDIACGRSTSACYFDLEVRQSHRRERGVSFRGFGIGEESPRSSTSISVRPCSLWKSIFVKRANSI